MFYILVFVILTNNAFLSIYSVFYRDLHVIILKFIRFKKVCVVIAMQCGGIRVFQDLHLMWGSCHIRNVLIGVEYQNWRQTLDAYLLFAIWMGQMQSKLIYIFVSFGLASL